MKKLRIIVGGYIGLYPTGGATWDYLQYPLGLHLMGHDVYYIEDTGQYPTFNPGQNSWNDAMPCINYLKQVMEEHGLGDRWSYRDTVTQRSYGLDDKMIEEICKTADVFINISCSTVMREEYMRIPARVLLDSDPMFTQIQYAKELDNESDLITRNTISLFDTHNHLFTFGENIYGDDCTIPRFDFEWKVTRQPICLHLWENEIVPKGKSFTSVMNWNPEKTIQFRGDKYGQKDVEFEKIVEAPKFFPEIDFRVVLNDRSTAEKALFDRLAKLNWNILHPDSVATPDAYRTFIHHSAAEFSVAKETYVKSNSGWFSCRSACYLASGRPVITQETGWSKYIPTGDGLFAFTDLASAREAIQLVEANLANQSVKAKEIASDYFDSDKVLNKMLGQL